MVAVFQRFANSPLKSRQGWGIGERPRKHAPGRRVDVGRWTLDSGAAAVDGVSTTRDESGSNHVFWVTGRICIRVIKPERTYSVELVGSKILPLRTGVNPNPFAGAGQVKLHDRSGLSSGAVFVGRIDPILRRS